MAPTTGLKHLSNALATPDQLSNSSSSLDGVPSDLETSVRCAGAQLTQSAGVLLRLSQDVIAQAIVTFTRFWLGADGGSLRIYSVKVKYDLLIDLVSTLTPDSRMSPPPPSTSQPSSPSNRPPLAPYSTSTTFSSPAMPPRSGS